MPLASPGSIRPATPSDHAAVLALLGAEGLPTQDVDASLRGFEVCEEDGRLTGAAGLEEYGRYGLLRSVVVAGDRRGHGLGHRLTEAVLDDARRRGLESVYALTTTAAAWFPRLGFEPIERAEVPAALHASSEFSTVCPASAAVLRHRLHS